MKTNFLALAICLCQAIFAQNRDTTTWFQQLQHRTALLNMQQTKTGLLYDKVPEGVSPLLYNGRYVDTINTLRPMQFRQLMWQHVLTGGNPEQTAELRYETIDTLNWHYVKQGYVPINVLSQSYDQLHEDAFAQGLIGFNNDSQLVHLSSASPFELFYVFASSVWYERLVGNKVNFILPRELFVTNISNEISTIQFKKEGADEYITVAMGEPFEVVFSDTGKVNCSIKVVYATGAAVESGFVLHLGKRFEYPQPDLMAMVVADVPFGGVCGLEPNYNAFGLARYYIKYANVDKKLRRPFIFVEGIDFDYRDYLTNPNNPAFPPAPRFGEFGWDVFVSGGIYPQSYPDMNHTGSAYSIGIQELSGPQGLIQQLLNQGYDIVLVDFARGADYVQKNALALVKVLKDLNAMKEGKEENVIVGASMGGLTTRYALAYMEKNNIPHCTRLWATFDSPHLGANIAIGLQYALLFFANNSVEAKENNRRLNLPAAKQMLIRHISRYNNGTYEQETFASCFRANLQIDMNIVGWPENLRKISMVNGNISALGNGIRHAEVLMYWNHRVTVPGKVAFLNLPIYTFDAARCVIKAQGLYAGTVFEGIISNPNTKKQLDFCWLSPLINVTKAANGNIIINASILPILAPCLKIEIIRHIKNETWTCPGGCPNLDGAPGGLHDGVNTMYEAIRNKTIKDGLTQPNQNKIGFSCFIPSISAVNAYNTNNYFQDLMALINPDNSEASQTPFESYKGPEQLWPNEGHVFLTKNNQWGNGYKGNKEWIIGQLNKNYMASGQEVPSALGITYNLGNKQLGKLLSVKVKSGGLFAINKQGRVGWQTSVDENAIEGSTLRVITSTCNPAKVEVEGQGQFVVGDAGPASGNNKAIVMFNTGSELHLKSGSTLIIHKGSRLVLGKGTTLFMEPNVNIHIAEGGVLEIEGQLNLMNNTVFEIKGVVGHGVGYVHFVNKSTTGQPQIIHGQNCKMSFDGNPLGSLQGNPTKLLQVSGAGGLVLPESPHQMEFEVLNARVQIDGLSKIECYHHIKTHYAVFEKTPGTNGRYLGVFVFEDITNYRIPIIDISVTKFYNGEKGLYLKVVSQPHFVTLNFVDFYNCSDGLITEGVGVMFNKSLMSNCSNSGWSVVNPQIASEGNDLTITGGTYGVWVQNGSYSQVKLNKTTILNSYTGGFIRGGELITRCSKFLNNINGMATHDYGRIYFNPSYQSGYNIIDNSIELGMLVSGEGDFDIINGNSVFAPHASTPYFWRSIGASAHAEPVAGCAMPNLSNGSFVPEINVSGNYIHPKIIYGNSIPWGGYVHADFLWNCGGVQQGIFNVTQSLSKQALINQVDGYCGNTSGEIPGDGGGGTMSMLSYAGSDNNSGTNSINISNDQFSNKTYAQAFGESLHDIYRKNNPNYIAGIAKLRSIIKQPNAANHPAVSKLKQNAYRQFNMAVGSYLTKGNNGNGNANGKQTVLNQAFDVVSYQINQSGNFSGAYRFYLDKANLYRLTNNRNQAILLMDSIIPLLTDSNRIRQAQRIKCICEYEQKVINKQLKINQSLNNYCNAFLNKSGGEEAVPNQFVQPQQSLTKQAETVLTVYPNPVANTLFVESDETIQQITVMDISGRTVYHQSKPGTHYQLDLTSLPSGQYQLKIEHAHQTINKKISVLH